MAYVKIKRLPQGGAAVSTVVPTPRGPIALSAVVPRRYLEVSGDEGESDEIAGLFDDIAKVASKVVHNKWVQRGAAAVAAIYGVPPGVTTRVLEGSADLLDAARAGTPAARAKVRRAAAAAAAGSPAGRTAMAALAHVDRARTDTRAALDSVSRAMGGDARARQSLDALAARARREPGNANVQRAANAVRATVEAMRRSPAPPARAGARQPPPPALPARAPRVSRVREQGGRRVIEIEV